MSAEVVGSELLHGQALALHDFDKTTHRTDELPEGGHGVESACELAVEKVLGQGALQWYVSSGGLRNRAPSAIIDQLRPDADLQTRIALAEDFVAAKLAVLADQIGRRLPDGEYWPRPVVGFTQHWDWLSETSGMMGGIVSSGHDEFISRVFDVHDLTPPDLMVTDDDMRPLMLTLPRYLCEKPAPLPAELALHRWLQRIGANMIADGQPLDLLDAARNQVVFIGDGLEQDGGLARNAGFEFVHLKVNDPKFSYDQMKSVLNELQSEAVHVGY